MAHKIEVLVISDPAELRKEQKRFRHLYIIPLEQGKFLVPVTDEFLHEVTSIFPSDRQTSFPEFRKLSGSLIRFCLELSKQQFVAYIETEYWGGEGEQAAIVWNEQRVVYGPAKLPYGPVNEALRMLGVTKGSQCDEFVTIGLHKFRSNEDWIEQPFYGHSS